MRIPTALSKDLSRSAKNLGLLMRSKIEGIILNHLRKSDWQNNEPSQETKNDYEKANQATN